MRVYLYCVRSYIFLVAAISLLLCFAPPADSQQLTTLRVVGKPNVTFEQIITPRITRVSVKVRNVGRVDATNIYVTATLPDGQQRSLYGPTTLGKNKTAAYSSSMYELVTRKGNVRVSTSCANCR